MRAEDSVEDKLTGSGDARATVTGSGGVERVGEWAKSGG